MLVKRRYKQYTAPQKSEPEYVYNDYITDNQLTVIDDEGKNWGVISKQEALTLAREKELDLVIVSRSQDQVVARIADLSKLKYDKSKKQKKNKGKSTGQKEIWFRPNIQERDMVLKLEKVKEFLEKGGNVKLTLKSDRRVPYNVMFEVMNKIVEKVSTFAKPINNITREGRNLSITVKTIK